MNEKTKPHSNRFRYNDMHHLMLRSRVMLFGVFFLCGLMQAQSTQTPSQLAQDVPVMDAGAGPCSLQLTVTTPDSKPVYAATIKVHIEYGFGGFRRLDLQASTNVNGKAKFVGLPSRVRRPPLEFEASKDELVGTATFDPAEQCAASHDIVLDKPKPSPAN